MLRITSADNAAGAGRSLLDPIFLDDENLSLDMAEPPEFVEEDPVIAVLAAPVHDADGSAGLNMASRRPLADCAATPVMVAVEMTPATKLRRFMDELPSA
ncbi:hypothetical protein [Bradyrhizobium sp. CCBAU 51627]|uniref:hypothetical protein n=1 Tax=Bradyrhizobium sp. CCBAU 51627 TaxID=1325088 RepID=UPI0023063E2E|nr:hypothetical protein [Bradyrhizobium sp. CCBAU 51627]MDA9436593.1 hypothetical protein [Bradyrhizobium sp. CCBAU 51627]